MRISKLKIAFLVLLCAALAWEWWHIRTASNSSPQNSPITRKNKPDFALLPADAATSFARFFAGPKAKIEDWEPTVADMNDVEADLDQITALSKKDPDQSRHIDDPIQYFRQYGAVSIDGRKVILLNAFCSLGVEKSGTWRKQFILVNDGGKCYWRASFDVSTQKFTTLAVNGIA